MHGTFSTADVEAKDRFAYWSDLVCHVFVNLDCRCESSGSFNARMRYGSFGPVRIVEAESDAIQGIRSRRQISRGREDDFLVVVQVGGQTALAQDGRRSMLSAGDYAVLDTERPYSLDMSEGTSTVWLQFPRTELLSRTGVIRPVLAKPMPGRAGSGAMFTHMVREAAGRMDEFGDSEKPDIAVYGLDLLALALSSSLQCSASVSSARSTALNNLKFVINRHLRDPGLTPSRAAQLGGLSMRHANRLLAAEHTSLERYIWSRRLERCKAALEDIALAHLTVGEIAYSWGVNDLSHFSRAFRKKFDISPSQLRKAVALMRGTGT